jgi:hypothetical protein
LEVFVASVISTIMSDDRRLYTQRHENFKSYWNSHCSHF